MLQSTPSAVLFKDLLFSVHYLLIISECWRRQKDKQVPIELENIPAIRQTQIGWVCSQRHSPEREQSLLLQEKGQLVSEAHGHINRDKVWDRHLEKTAQWKLHTHEQAVSFRGWKCALAGCRVQELGHKCATANLTALAQDCPSPTLCCSSTGFKHQHLNPVSL